jgi:predicted transcriptional regulator
MASREELHRLVDEIAESQMETARKILEKLPVDVDDDPLSPEELAEIEEGAAQIARGEYVTLDELARKPKA